MLKYMLLLLLLPSVASAQPANPVMPVESKDYLDMIAKDSLDKMDSAKPGAGTNRSLLEIKGNFRNTNFQKIEVKGKYLKIHPHKVVKVALGGTLSTTFEIKRANTLPGLQKQYVQGRSNGQLQWNGPETGELFSYGPAVSSLEFDGSNYDYDRNGRLVPVGTGNGNKSIAYNNRILRTGPLFTQSFGIQAHRFINGVTKWIISTRMGYTNENTILKENINTGKTLSSSMTLMTKPLKFTGTYTYTDDKFSNANRNGFINRVYQNALLTPISFDNSQGAVLGNGQRSYSQYADNPYFLLQNNPNRYKLTHHTGGLGIQNMSFKKLSYSLLQSVDLSKESSVEAYKPGTNFFQDGIFTTRDKRDRTYFLKASSSLRIEYGYRDLFESYARVNYIFSHASSDIKYSRNPLSYNYKRASHDADLSFNTYYNGDDISAGIELGNKAYISTTSSKNNFFLPATGAFVHFKNIFDNLNIKLSSTLTQFNSEIPLDRSMSHANLLQVPVSASYTYFPLTEVSSFDNLKPVHHKEWTGKLELIYSYKIQFTGEVFVKNTSDDVYPVYVNDQLLLRNIADHRKSGVELYLKLFNYLFRNTSRTGKELLVDHSISFLSWNNKVTGVRDGFDYTPLAGFSNVHKAIVKGQQFGSILGSSFQRDPSGNFIIGADGFPLADNQLRVIGNPIPDFIMKLNNTLTWKRFTMSFDWEWRKGGEAWNGTQAMLDYYGRSQHTAALRNTTSYVFEGVTVDDHRNTTPVSFYDPSRPFEENRWVRYGPGGVAEEYIQKTDQVRLQSVALSYKHYFKRSIQSFTLTTYLNNLVLWSAFKGADPAVRLLYDQPNTSGLDFFNLPATKTYGLTASIQF